MSKKKFWKVNVDDTFDFWKERGVGDYYGYWDLSNIGDSIYINHSDLGLKNGHGEYGLRTCIPMSFKFYIEHDYEYMGEFIPRKQLRKLKLNEIRNR